MRDVTDWPIPLQVEYFAARRVWLIRHELVPGDEAGRSWSAWYRDRFGRTLEQAREAFSEAPAS